MSQKTRGRAVIINNKYFLKSEPRDGCDKDVEDLQKLFNAIHFEVILHQNQTAEVICFLLVSISSEGNGIWFNCSTGPHFTTVIKDNGFQLLKVHEALTFLFYASLCKHGEVHCVSKTSHFVIFHIFGKY